MTLCRLNENNLRQLADLKSAQLLNELRSEKDGRKQVEEMVKVKREMLQSRALDADHFRAKAAKEKRKKKRAEKRLIEQQEMLLFEARQELESKIAEAQAERDELNKELIKEALEEEKKQQGTKMAELIAETAEDKKAALSLKDAAIEELELEKKAIGNQLAEQQQLLQETLTAQEDGAHEDGGGGAAAAAGAAGAARSASATKKQTEFDCPICGAVMDITDRDSYLIVNHCRCMLCPDCVVVNKPCPMFRTGCSTEDDLVPEGGFSKGMHIHGMIADSAVSIKFRK